MKKFNALLKKYSVVFQLLFMLAVSQSTHSQQNKDDAFVYVLKKDWSTAKYMKEATYFMQLIPENDTTYICRYYNKFGSMVRQESFLDSMHTIPNGRFCWYDQNGMLDSTGLVYRYHKTGVWKYYNDNGEPTLSIVYNNGRMVEKRDYLKEEITEEKGNNIKHSIKEKAEQDALDTDSSAGNTMFKNVSFGESNSPEQWKEYLKEHITVPERFTSVYVRGGCIVEVSFAVNKEGKTDDVYLTHSCEWSVDNEVLNAVRKSPLWKVAEKDGSNTDYCQQQAITFHSAVAMNSGSENKSSVFIGAQIPAKFPGSEQAWQRYLYGKINMTVPENHNAPAGQYTVVVFFVVEKDGTRGEVNALDNPGYGTAEELIRVIKKSPKWIPAMQDGKPVIYSQRQAITFHVSQD